MRGKVAGLFYFLSLYITWSGKPNLNRCGAVPESPNNRLQSPLTVKDARISSPPLHKLILEDKWGSCFM